jgi:hypothetical protein
LNPIQKWKNHFGEKIKLTFIGKFPEGQLVIVVDGIVVGSALSLLVTEDFAFKNGLIKLSQEILRFQLTILMEKFYTN